ncbi:MAG: hypothetical protein NVSMB47_04630 [Polyangiales bacterium]
MITTADVIAEARALGALRGVSGDPFERALTALEVHFQRYAELVVTESGIELITGGVGPSAGNALASIAVEHGASPAATRAFLACAQAFGARMLGLKLCFGSRPSTPTLYVRLRAPKSETMRFLAEIEEVAPALPALECALVDNDTIYGLGFFDRDGALALKTYSLAGVTLDGSAVRPGFVSFRVAGGQIARDVKRYLPDLRWDQLPVALPGVDQVMARVACERVGHVGVVESEGRAPEVKLYLERIGAIPTDHSAR